jgi:hypothetical protein
MPLQSEPIAIDLCPRHLRGLIGRRLDRGSFLVLARQLGAAGLQTGRIFLLHDAFYDQNGRALQPVEGFC